MDFNSMLSNNKGEVAVKEISGGTPISQELAIELRRFASGSSIHSFSSEFKNAAIVFQPLQSVFPYGLYTEKNGSRGIAMCIQAYILRHLIFKYLTREEILRRNVLDPNNYQRNEAYTNALCHLLWQAGEKKKCTVSVIQNSASFDLTLKQYKSDGVTERLHLFEFLNYDELRIFVKKNIDIFEAPNGCLCFLYSLILSRTMPKIREDFGEGRIQMLTDNEECSQSLINLMLTGKATQYLHNGTYEYDDEAQRLRQPLRGVQDRADVGFLYWHREQDDRHRTQVGSMLKTPKYPVWVTHVNGQFGCLFSVNPDLVKDWRSEHSFTLHYLTGLSSQKRDAKLTVDTRYGKTSTLRSLRGQREEQKKIPAVDRCIMTKWHGADVTWNGVMPFV